MAARRGSALARYFFFFFLRFFFFWDAGGVGADAAGGGQACSVGVVRLLRGEGVASEKSAALLSLSSIASISVEQPRASVRVRDWPAFSAGAGLPTDGAVPVELPQLTQSIGMFGATDSM